MKNSDFIPENLNKALETMKKYERPNFGDLKNKISSSSSPAPYLKRRWTVATTSISIFLIFIFGTIIYSSFFIFSVSEPPTESNVVERADYSDVKNALNIIFEEKSSKESSLTNEIADGSFLADTARTFDSVGSEEASPMDGASLNYGTTNTQVIGVDENDIVKNDGKNIYTLSSVYNRESQYFLISVVSAEDFTLLSQTRFDVDYSQESVFLPSSIFVSGDRLVVIGTGVAGNDYIHASSRIANVQSGTSEVMIYEIGADGNLNLVRTFSQEGSLITARLYNDTIYLISSKMIYSIDNEVSDDDIHYILPSVSDSSYGNEPVTVRPFQIAIASNPDSIFTVASAIDLSDDTRQASTQSVMGSYVSYVYCDKNSLYILSNMTDSTEILKYNLDGADIRYDSTGTVPGLVTGQFAMDSHNGFFRIATTIFSDEKENRIYIFDENLNEISRTELLAPGETIMSVRYMGNMAYIVTFLQVDPLFAVDISDPYNPLIMGQLKIPGFSNYMHPIDETTLIGIGYDADEETGFTKGMKFSLFDVSDPLNPIESTSLILSEGSYSPAQYDHKAVLYIKDDGTLCVPIDLYDDVSIDGMSISKAYKSVALVLSVDKSLGFSFEGFLSDPMIDDNYLYGREISRITYIDRTLYTISNQSIISSSRNDLSFMGQIDFYEATSDDSNYIQPYNPIEPAAEPYTNYAE